MTTAALYYPAMRRWTLALCLIASCTEDRPAAKVPKPEPEKPATSAWKEIETPVPVGKKIACNTALPPDRLGALLLKKIELVDESARDADATSVCRVMSVDKKGKVGDEICMVSIYCWAAYDVADLTKRCDARGEQTNVNDVGLMTCVKTVPAGDHDRHVITTLDPDTRCKVVVNAAPNQFDLAQTKACARAALDALDKSTLKP